MGENPPVVFKGFEVVSVVTGGVDGVVDVVVDVDVVDFVVAESQT